jgi:hypothetical protein
MSPIPAVPRVLNKRLALVLGTLALTALAAPASSLAAPKPAPAAAPAVLSLRMMDVGSPGNPAVGIVPFTDAIYKSCAEAPDPEGPKAPVCQEVGGVAYAYGVNQLEVTVKQYVGFLNTVDPTGSNRHNLYAETESGNQWPRFGEIDFNGKAKPGRHYSLAAPEWADKPYGYANFLRAARFDNSLANGKVLSKKTGTTAGFPYVAYRVRLSRNTETGMYDMATRAPVRTKSSGFVIPSQDEWIKAAYYDPQGTGTYSYWKYPTNAGVFGDKYESAPVQATLNPKTGDVTNASGEPTAIFHNAETTPPSWCPSLQTALACKDGNPFKFPPKAYEKIYAGSVGTVGQSATYSPWGTLDQGGNVVEWTDTITPPPFGAKGHRVWRRLHGGIANAPVYQLWLSAVGLNPQDNAAFTATYPWLGIRIGVIGNAGGSGK